MSKRKSTSKKAKQMPATAPKRVRVGRNLNVWLPEPLMQALERYVNESRPRTDKTAVAEVAVEEFLTTRGYWPPAEPPGE